MPGRRDVFLDLSARLTGFGRVELVGTDMVDTYERLLDDVLPPGLLGELLSVFETFPAGVDADAATASEILEHPKLGPVAQALILVWYSGTWTALPDVWHAAYGSSTSDTTRVVSAQAYQAGLQWVVAGAHPAGARQQGYGAWAMAPEAGAR